MLYQRAVARSRAYSSSPGARWRDHTPDQGVLLSGPGGTTRTGDGVVRTQLACRP